MTSIDKSLIQHLLDNGPNRTLVGGKQLTLAFGGLYIASTTLKSKPLLVWEGESGYARYYVPEESLHRSIKAQVDGGRSNVDGESVTVDVVDTVEGKEKSKANIERLRIGSRSTTWVHFTEGALKGFIRFEPKDLDAWFENGAIIMGIKNPFKRIDTKPISSHVVVKVDGKIVAETAAPVILNETGLKDAYYLPATSILDWNQMEKSDWRSQCPYKGEAWYYNLTVNGKKHDNAIWYYPYPTHESSGVEGFISFYNREGTDILVDGVKVGDLESKTGVRNPVASDMRLAVPNDGSLDFPWSRL